MDAPTTLHRPKARERPLAARAGSRRPAATERAARAAARVPPEGVRPEQSSPRGPRHYAERSERERGLRVSIVLLALLHAAFTGGDLGQAAINTLPGGSALQQLINTRSAQDLEVNGVTAGMTGFNNLSTYASASDPQTGGSALGGIGALYGINTGASGPSVGVTLNIGEHSSETDWTQSDVSQLSANNISINVNHNANLIGGTQAIATQDLSVSAGNNINITAAADTFHQSSQSAGASIGSSLGMTGASGLSVSGNFSNAKANSTSYQNAQLQAGNNLSLTSGKDTGISGANISGNQVNLNVGGNLTIASLQDTSSSFYQGGSLGLSDNGAFITPSVSWQQGNASGAWTDHPTTIQSKDGTTITVQYNTDLVGSQISAANGNLNLKTGTLSYSNLTDHQTSSSTGFNFSNSFGLGGPSSGSVSGGQPAPSAGISGSIGFNQANADKEGVTKATVGTGNITTIQNTDLANLNRDLSRAQSITHDSHQSVSVVIPLMNFTALGQQADQIGTALHNISTQLSGPQKVEVQTIQQVYEEEQATGLTDQEAIVATATKLHLSGNMQLIPLDDSSSTLASAPTANSATASSPTTSSPTIPPAQNYSDMPPPYDETHEGMSLSETDQGPVLTVAAQNPTDEYYTDSAPVFTNANDLLNSDLYLTDPGLSDHYASQLSRDQQNTYYAQVTNLQFEQAVNQYAYQMTLGGVKSIASIPQSIGTFVVYDNTPALIYDSASSLDQAVTYPGGFSQYYTNLANQNLNAIYNQAATSLSTPEGQGALLANGVLLVVPVLGEANLEVKAASLESDLTLTTAPLLDTTSIVPLEEIPGLTPLSQDSLTVNMDVQMPELAVQTPHGVAIQSSAIEALTARDLVNNGVTLYRIGTMGKSAASEAQFWSLENPLSANYASKYGLAPENVINADFIESGTLKSGSIFITRPAPAVGINLGGGIEIVVPENGVVLKSFNTLGEEYGL